MLLAPTRFVSGVRFSRCLLAARPEELFVFLPPATRKPPKLDFPYHLAALTVWRPQLWLTALLQALAMNIPGECGTERICVTSKLHGGSHSSGHVFTGQNSFPTAGKQGKTVLQIWLCCAFNINIDANNHKHVCKLSMLLSKP